MKEMVPETYFTISEELVLFLYSVIFGALLGAIYDFFRALRSVLKHNFAAVFIEDCIFFVIYSVLLMCFAVMFSRSQVRLYYAFGNLLGFALYHFTLGNIILAVIRKIVFVIKNMVEKFCFLISKTSQKIVLKIVKNAENVRIGKKMNANVLQNVKTMVYNENGLLFDDIDKRRNSGIYNTDKKDKREAKKSGKVKRKEKG